MSDQAPSDLCKAHESRISRLEERIHVEREHSREIIRLQERFGNERDLRYKEVGLERDKALKIKEEADKVALDLAREIQKYKDEKANELREQINRERGLYASKDDLTAAIREIKAEIKPLSDFVATRQGQSAGFKMTGTMVVGIATVFGVVLLFSSMIVGAAVFIPKPPANSQYQAVPASVEVTNDDKNKVPVKQ